MRLLYQDLKVEEQDKKERKFIQPSKSGAQMILQSFVVYAGKISRQQYYCHLSLY